MALNEIEIKALNEIKAGLEYSNSIIYDLLRNNWQGDDEKADMISELVRDWSNITHDQYGVLERLGNQHNGTLESFKILEKFVIESKNLNKPICQGCNSNQNGNLINKLLDKTEKMLLCPNCINDLNNNNSEL